MLHFTRVTALTLGLATFCDRAAVGFTAPGGTFLVFCLGLHGSGSLARIGDRNVYHNMIVIEHNIDTWSNQAQLQSNKMLKAKTLSILQENDRGGTRTLDPRINLPHRLSPA